MSISTRLKGFLDENQIPYSVMTHTRAYTAQGAAATMQISGKELAKTIVLGAGEEMILAVLPAPNHVRLDKLAAKVGKSVRLATEAEFSNLFPDCELGAMPPFGSLYNLPVYVDESLAADSHAVRRLCSSGEAQGLLIRSERVMQTISLVFLGGLCSDGFPFFG